MRVELQSGERAARMHRRLIKAQASRRLLGLALVATLKICLAILSQRRFHLRETLVLANTVTFLGGARGRFGACCPAQPPSARLA